jgi:alpha-L-fucosidase
MKNLLITSVTFITKQKPRNDFMDWKAVLTLSALLILTLTVSAMPEDKKVEESVKKIEGVVAKGPYRASWDSLERFKVPTWYEDAKFGIFIHWGAYCVPAFDNEWYPRDMYMQDNRVFKYHLKTYGPQSKFGYKDFIPMFKAEKFNADQWAELFKKAGAKYVVPVAEHHDGFPMYASELTEWCAAKMGPKRDVVGELSAGVRKQGLHFGASSHRAEHWWFFNGGTTFDSDVNDPRYAGLYGPAQSDKVQPNSAYLDNWLARIGEIVDKYHPEIVWFDWWIEQPAFKPYLEKFGAFYYNRAAEWKREVAINYKNQAFPEHVAVLDIERGQLDTLRPLFWQTDTSVGEKSWGYIKDEKFRTPESLIDELVDIVSKNGCLLLNIGPKSDGTIPEEVQQVLLDMGKWLSVNGEAIYATRPWKVYGEGPTKVVGGSFKDTATNGYTAEDIRFTAKGDTLYAIALAWPKDGELRIQSLAAGSELTKREIKTVQMLGSKARVKWTRNAEGLIVELLNEKPSGYPIALKIFPVDRAAAQAE